MVKKDEKCECRCHHKKMGGGWSVYSLGFIGAAVYYIGTAATFWIGVLGFLKAVVWPALLVYTLMQYIGM
ncbi:MAG TPA: hypothetical protein P5096_03255 [Patescibacteria group bacterium]|nr:hypothetical protein [Patescibacteria group bacterium]